MTDLFSVGLMRRLWLLFAQTVTVCLGVLFIVTTLRPDWLQPSVTAPTPRAPVAALPAPMMAAGTPEAPSSYAQAVALAAPAVVNVYTLKHVNVPLLPLSGDRDLDKLFRSLPGFSRRRESTSLGSGVVVRPDGYILTNFHVVEAADAIEVALNDGREASATLVGADPESDLAVLKIDLSDLSTVRFDSGRKLQVGDVVFAIGNPFGVGQTTTMGIVSALGRNRLGATLYEDFIQTDAAINPGNSGGALVDTAGRLVGLNTAIYSQSGGSLGIGFAIPAGTAYGILEEIIANGTVVRGWLGLEPQDLTPELAAAFGLQQEGGVIIAQVLRDGPAWQAGLRVSDIVIEIQGRPVHDAMDLLSQIAPFRPGSAVPLTVIRDGKKRQVIVKAGARPPPPVG